MSTVIPDTHPLKPGYYYIDIQQAHVVAYPHDDNVAVTNEVPDVAHRIWILSLWGRGYKIQNFATRKYAYVPEGASGEVIHLDDQASQWNIQKDGEGIYRIVFPDKDLYWTETVIWGVRRFKLFGSDGAKDQMLTFKPFLLK